MDLKRIAWMTSDKMLPALKREERDLHRPGHIIFALLICGIVIGAALIGIAWESWNVYQNGWNDDGTSILGNP